MGVNNRFTALTTLEKWMDHVADDRSRANDCHLNYDVIKLLRSQTWKTRHLGAAFNLKHANCVCLLQRGINSRVIRWQMSQIHLFSISVADQFDRVFKHSHHA